MNVELPTLAEMRARHAQLRDQIIHTPSVPVVSDKLRQASGAELFLKLELMQHTGTFKARGALSVVNGLSDAEKKRGITAVSAGNHAVAAAWAARRAGASAKVVMIGDPSPLRVERARAEGAEVVFMPSAAEAFGEVERLVAEEGLTFVHPFEGPNTTLGAAGVGLELMDDIADLDAVVVSIGGGGLISGVAAAVKAINPNCKVWGVEPEGAANMSKSRTAGEAVKLDAVNSIADSLSPPYSLPYSFAINAACVDDVVTLDDDLICAGVNLLMEEAKLAVEPAAGAVLAGALGPLKARLVGKRVGLVICGANIDASGYMRVLERGKGSVSRLLGV